MMLPLAWGCTHSHSHDHEAEDAHMADEHDHAHNGDIILDPAMATRLGVAVGTVESGPFSRVIRATGTMERSATDVASAPAPASGTLRFAPGISAGCRVERGAVIGTIDREAVVGGDAEAAARAEYDAAASDMARIESLYADRLVTAAEYNAAKAALGRAKAALSRGGESGAVTSPVSGTVTAVTAAQGAYVQAGDPVAEIAADGPLTLKVDVPSRYYRDLTSVTDARFAVGSDSTMTVSGLGGHRLPGSASVGSAGYVPVYFSVPFSYVPAGATADVWLLGDSRDGVLTVPVTALSEQQGTYYVYLAVHPAHGAYRKRPVTIGATDGERAEVTSGLKAGDKIVMAGTTAVRLAEMQSVVPEGHSHNH